MKTTSIRVRPVIRHAVTRHTSEVMEDGRGSGGSECLGEFSHESYAEEVAQALQEKHAPREFVIVERTLGAAEARVTYAYSEEEAVGRLASEEAVDGKEYRIYSRIKPSMVS